jgi:hypothetical protein
LSATSGFTADSNLGKLGQKPPIRPNVLCSFSGSATSMYKERLVYDLNGKVALVTGPARGCGSDRRLYCVCAI